MENIALIVRETKYGNARVFFCLFDPPIKEWNDKDKGYVFYNPGGYIEFYEADYYDESTRRFGNRSAHTKFDHVVNWADTPEACLRLLGVTLIRSSKELP